MVPGTADMKGGELDMFNGFFVAFTAILIAVLCELLTIPWQGDQPQEMTVSELAKYQKEWR